MPHSRIGAGRAIDHSWKNSMKRQLCIGLLTVFLACWAINLDAQVNPHPGYIISLQNDTIRGTVDFRTAGVNSHSCIFLADGESEYRTYSATDISGYRLTDTGKYYVSRSVEVNGEKDTFFLEYLIKGIVSLYYLYYQEADFFFFEDEQGQMHTTCITDSNGIDGEKNWRQRRAQIIRPIFEVFQASPETQKELTESSLDKRHFSELTKEYHNRVCTSAEECVTFEYDKDEKAFLVKFHASVGMTYFRFSSTRYTDRWGFEEMSQCTPNISIGADMYFPRISNRFYSQLMVNYSPVHLKKKNVIYQQGTLETPYTYYLDASLINILLGGACRLGSGKWIPILQAGISCSILNGIEAGTDASQADGSPWRDDMFMPQEILAGAYGGFLLEYPIKKHALYANLSYQYIFQDAVSAQAVSFRIGYKF